MITRHEPTKPMLLEAKEAGQFKPKYSTAFDRMQIVTVQQILDGARMSLPLVKEDDQPSQLGSTDLNQSEIAAQDD